MNEGMTWDCAHERHDACHLELTCTCDCHDELWAALWLQSEDNSPSIKPRG